MQLEHKPPHGRPGFRALKPARAVEECAPQAELGQAPVGVDPGREGEQAVRLARARVSGRVAAPHRYGRRRLFHHLEVVRYDGSWLVI